MIQISSRPLRLIGALASIFTFVLLFSACQTPSGHRPTAEDSVPPVLKLAPGDVIEVTFPGATNLSGIHRIGPEGGITLPLVGQIQAGGKTSEELQTQVVALYQNELKDSNVLVSIASSGNVVYVDGAVLRPGKIQLDRPLTALETVMECGGFQPVANQKKVTIIRYNGNNNKTIDLNLEPVLSGGPVPPFYVRPRDIVHVPTKMQWF